MCVEARLLPLVLPCERQSRVLRLFERHGGGTAMPAQWLMSLLNYSRFQ